MSFTDIVGAIVMIALSILCVATAVYVVAAVIIEWKRNRKD